MNASVTYQKHNDVSEDNSKRDDAIYRMHKEGMPYRKIGKLFDMSSTRAFNIVCRIDYERLSNGKRQY